MARRTGGADHDRLFALAEGYASNSASYAANTDGVREINVFRLSPAWRGLVAERPGQSPRMEQTNDPPSTPKDASEATDDQRDIQDKLDHQDDDPDAPGGHQTKDQVADET